MLAVGAYFVLWILEWIIILYLHTSDRCILYRLYTKLKKFQPHSCSHACTLKFMWNGKLYRFSCQVWKIRPNSWYTPLKVHCFVCITCQFLLHAGLWNTWQISDKTAALWSEIGSNRCFVFLKKRKPSLLHKHIYNEWLWQCQIH